MFGHRFYGARFYGPRYWGDGGTGGGPGPGPADDTQNARLRRARVSYRYGILIPFLFLLGCAHGRFVLSPPLEQRPNNDLLWASTGAALDGGLQLAKVKPWPRIATVVGAGVVVRYTTIAGRPRDSGVAMVFGMAVVELVGFFFCRGPCGR